MASSWRRLLLLTLVLSITYLPISITQDFYPDFVSSESINNMLIFQSKSVIDYQYNSDRTGILLTSALPPNIGRLLVKNKSSKSSESCSGIAINPTKFITAAHCVCDIGPNASTTAEDCKRNLNELSLSIFFPRFGIISNVKDIEIHNKYYSPTIRVNQTRQVADLAILTFDQKIKVNTIKIGYSSGKYLMASFGKLYFANTEHAKELGFPIGSPLQEGVAQVSRFEHLYTDVNACGEYHAADTGCSWYNPLAVTVKSGPLQGATVCPGDSGAPILHWSAADGWSLVGITSYFSPQNNLDRCQADSPRRNHYVLVSSYKDWIQSHVQNEISTAIPPRCFEGLFRSGTIDLFKFRGLITGTGFDVADGTKRPTININANESECVEKPDFGVVSCILRNPGYVEINIRSGFGQITLCEDQ